MPALPTPGGSSGTWGTDLNTWLQYGHRAIGTHFDNVFNVEDTRYGATPDAFYTDGVATNASTTFTSATAAFVAGDAGKTVVILNAGASSLQHLHTTIASVTNGTTVVLSHAAGRTNTGRFYISRGGDQTTAIQAAITAAGAAGGGIVQLPGVGYLVSQLSIPSRVTVRGMGMRATLVHQVHASNKPIIVNDPTANNSGAFIGVRDLWLSGARNRQSNITTTTTANYTAASSTTLALTSATGFLPVGSVLVGTNRLTYTSISGNTLQGVAGGREGSTDANSSSGATVTQHAACGIVFTTNPYNTFGTSAETYDPHSLVENVMIDDCKGDGIQAWGQSEIRWRNVWCEYCDQFGFRPSFDHWLSDCTSSNSGRSGFYLFSSEVKATNCKAFFSGGVTAAEGWGFLVEGPTSIEEGTKTLSSCDTQDNKAEGYYLRTAQRVHLTGTASSNCVTAGSGAGILIDGCTNGIIDLVCTERSASATQIYGAKILSTSVTTAGMKIRLTHGASAGAGAVSTALAASPTLTGGVDISINGMGGMTSVSPAGAGTLTPDPYVATTYLVQMPAGNITIAAPANAHYGCALRITIIQDGTGSRTVTWNAAYKFTGATSPTLTTTASRRDTFSFLYNGTNWQEESRALNVG